MIGCHDTVHSVYYLLVQSQEITRVITEMHIMVQQQEILKSINNPSHFLKTIIF